jgi:hypothetical protein
MAELRKDFSKARMNKDMDERLVPPGEYRDANNIQISTSDGSDIGTVQSLFSNKSRALVNYSSTGAAQNLYGGSTVKHTIVGSVADASKDKIYYLVSGGDQYDSSSYNSTRKDYIVEYDTVKETNKYVFVDIFGVDTTVSGTPGSNTTFHIALGAGSSIYNIGVRVGMNITSTATTPNTILTSDVIVTNVEYDTSGGTNKWKITTNKAHGLSDTNALTFESKRVLNFSKFTLITGINILDDFIYWTDNEHEPKKISISRSIAGTGGTVELNTEATQTFNGDTDNFHTRLVKTNNAYANVENILSVAVNNAGARPVYVDESHVTVIRKSPTQPLELDMFRTGVERIKSNGDVNPTEGFVSNVSLSFGNVTSGNQNYTNAASITFDDQVDFRDDDILLITLQDNLDQDLPEEDYFDIRVRVLNSPITNANNISFGPFIVEFLGASVDGQAYLNGTSTDTLSVKLDTKDVIFKHKFPRFSYRYKYQDGEYSTFAPFSEVAFLTDDYEYQPKKGYNFGMSNQLRGLKISGFVGNEDIMPEDVVEIDILYKETNNPTVYSVKTIKPTDTEWPSANGITDGDRGELLINTDLIHAVVPSNQLLRPYDNVPRKALAQEITANRLIYGNYVQNYTVDGSTSLNVGCERTTYADGEFNYAPPSVKSIRKYQVGVVFSDEYGRETPVLSSKSSSISIPINYSDTRNRISVSFDPKKANVPSWAKYFSYYIKEPSAEYYTMANDRWYNADDGNIWLSFPSADRNKIQEDDTIILKKAAGQDTAVKIDNRYKVLAISNEAPDFIKRTRKVLGSVTGTLGVIGEASGNLYPLPNSNKIQISGGNFITAFGDKLHVLTPDELYLKVSFGNNQSEEYEVSRLIKDGAVTENNPEGSGDFILTTTKVFGQDMAFTSPTESAADAVDTIRIELIEYEVQNKPEFDGRFFVKIYKDSLVQQYVLIDQNQDLVPTLSWELRYLNNNGYNNVAADGSLVPPTIEASSGAFPYGISFAEDINGNEALGSTFVLPSDSGDSLHPTEWSYHTPAYDWTSDYVSADDIDDNPIQAINNHLGTILGGGGVSGFWQSIDNANCFFIDQATAYSWDGYNRPGQMGIDDDFYSIGGLASNYSEGGITFGGVVNTVANTPGSSSSNAEHRGQPSRGIWTDGVYSYIDISWVGANPGYNTPGADNQNFNHLLQNDQQSQDAWEFIQELVTPNTTFRFSRDPDAQEYTVQGTYGYGGSSTTTIDYSNPNFYANGTTNYTGVFGIRNFRTLSTLYSNKDQFRRENMRQRWTIKVFPAIGDTARGYNPVKGTKPPTLGGPISSEDGYRRALHHDFSDFDTIQILEPISSLTGQDDTFTENPAVWEIEPRESVELDIYYQASPKIPIVLDNSTNEELLPIGSTFVLPAQEATQTIDTIPETTHTITGWDEQTITFTPALTQGYQFIENQVVRFNKYNNYSLDLRLDIQASSSAGGTTLKLSGGPSEELVSLQTPYQTHYLDWSNCWCFGNGVESDRVRDMFNDPQMDNGVKASTVLADPSLLVEERRKHGLIWSGIYNGNSGINETNQFIQAEPITKDINPVYGSIQRLLNRETRLVMFCEDKVLRAVTNKDALYNADGNPQLVSSNAVVGDVTPYAGRYGIGRNPESLAVTPSSSYFTDVIRGKVLALSNSGDGVREISAVGMKDYFADYMAEYVGTARGSYDSRKKEYNITINKKYENYQAQPHEQTTVSYSEYSKGWISFKSYYPDTGVSLNNKYYTFKNGLIWEHHYEQDAGTSNSQNQFYGTQYKSDVTAVFNEMSESVKGFSTIKYEGSKSAVPVFQSLNNQNYFNGDYSTNNGLVDTDNVNDGEYYNIFGKNESPLGWYVDNLETNLQTCGELYFKNKEGKYYAYPTGETTALTNLDTREFSVQGIGQASIVHGDNTVGNQATLTFINNISSSESGMDDTDGSPQAVGITRWTVSSATYSATVGTAIGSSQSVEMIISPFYDGVYTGHPVTASNFELQDGNESPTGTFTVDSDTKIKTGSALNVNSAVSSVVFSDTSVAGDPANTVKVTVNLRSDFNPSGDSTTILDIDETEAKSSRDRSSCLLVQYDNLDNATETINAVTGISTSNVVNTSHVVTEHSGNVAEGETNIIASYTFSATGTSYYQGGDLAPAVIFVDLGEYEGYYEAEVEETLTSGNITQFTVKIKYTPPTSGYLVQDPVDMCALSHKAIIKALIETPAAAADIPGISSVVMDSEAMALPNMKSILVNGSAGSKYQLSFEKKTSLTSGVTASSAGHYNFVTNTFVDNPAPITGTIPNSGFIRHYVALPSVTADTRYDATISGIVGSETSTLASRVPTAPGDMSMTQRGVRTITITPTTQTASDFGVIPTATVTRLANTNSDRPLPTSRRVTAICETSGSSTKLTISKQNGRIKEGMIVIDVSSNTSVPHETTVSEIRDGFVILSTACNIAQNTSITFIENRGSLASFSLRVPAGSGKTLALNSSAKPRRTVGGLGSLSFVPDLVTSSASRIRPSTTEYTTAQQFEIVSQIPVGAAVSGDKVTITGIEVTAVDTSIPAFDISPADPNVEQSRVVEISGDINEGISVEQVITSLVGGDLMVQGYLDVPQINITSTVPIFIDNLVNVTP